MKYCQTIRFTLAALLSLFVLLPSLTAASRTAPRKSSTSHVKSAKSSSKVSSSSHKRGSHGGKLVKGKRSGEPVVRRARGQQGIDSSRAREIQQALIRERYLDGEPTGVWDSQTRAAMTHFQGDNGWQTKVTPDARALIKLGLGPTHEGLLNPDSAAVPMPVSQLGREREIPGGTMQR